ncbi:SLC13 family permease [Nitrospirillum amazonense]|uniref:YbiR family transporter n=1 Tax=Nitrospirillum amazonense TaxID=28077 RepID=A0A560JBP6_9PROT|nr:SLC13 family permease [Nitrospirillum amazonense]MDG3441006.1 SLC13 family permease [Nitrospirillum amazonense]TWB65840.1 YbiR family transporter [Nitrospirillum amazonense]
MTLLILVTFAVVYLGMAIGHLPRLKVDRTGIAMLGAIVLLVAGAVTEGAAIKAIDFPTLFILLGLMILSAQFALSGFYDWCAWRLANVPWRPEALLAAVVVVAGGLSALLANDVVVFAMTPLLCAGLRARGLDARPYLIALAGAANAGSAATVIGNPQNILIGQLGHLGFWHFLFACGVPAFLSLVIVYWVVARVWRGHLSDGQAQALVDRKEGPPDAPRAWQLSKGLIGVVVLLVAFTTPFPRDVAVLGIAGCMLVSRRFASRDMLGLVDWHLLALFAGLFILTGALADTGLPGQLVDQLAASGLALERLPFLGAFSVLASNSIGNVPAVVLLMKVWAHPPEGALYALALFSTLAGNLLLPGSLANIITVERAAAAGVTLGFRDHARCGVPMTVLSLLLATVWLLAMGYIAAV